MLKEIKTDKQYAAAWERLTELVKKEATLNSKESAELNLLSTIVQEYEIKRFPPGTHPAETLKFRLDHLQKLRKK